MNDYEAKIEARRERYEARADKARAESRAAEKASRAISDQIPMGQPILVGHHSERRHRRDLARMDRQMSRAVEAEKRAEYYERKARSVGRHGISSDDPDATVKLRDKIAKLEESRKISKAANAAVRKRARQLQKAGQEPDWPAEIESLSVSTDVKLALLGWWRAFPRSVPQLDTKSTGAEIRRCKKRIAELEQLAQAEHTETEGEGYRVEECPDANRLRIYFDEKPPADLRKQLKAHGFRWSPSVGAWQRQLNNGARYAAQRVLGVRP